MRPTHLTYCGSLVRINPNQPLNDKIPAPYRPLPAKKFISNIP
jgi:hypothetical protein